MYYQYYYYSCKQWQLNPVRIGSELYTTNKVFSSFIMKMHVNICITYPILKGKYTYTIHHMHSPLLAHTHTHTHTHTQTKMFACVPVWVRVRECVSHCRQKVPVERRLLESVQRWLTAVPLCSDVALCTLAGIDCALCGRWLFQGPTQWKRLDWGGLREKDWLFSSSSVMRSP